MTNHRWHTMLSPALAFFLLIGCLFNCGTSNGLLWGQDQAGEGEQSVENKRILTKLESTMVTWAFEEAPFVDAINFCRATCEINIVLDTRERLKLEQASTKVTLDVHNLKLKEALRILLEFYNFGYVLKDGFLFITSKENVAIGKNKPKRVVEAKTAEDQATLTRLQDVVSLDFSESPFGEIIDFIRTRCDINIVISPAVYQNFSSAEELSVDITVDKLSVETILNIVTEMKGLTYSLERGVVVIDVYLVVKDYPIQKLLDLSGMKPGYLLAVMQKECELGRPAKEAAIAIENGTLIVKQHPAVVAKVAALLEKLMAGLEAVKNGKK